MYPPGDFRTLIRRWTEINTPKLPRDDCKLSCRDEGESAGLRELIIKSISREPLPELLNYWRYHGREDYLLSLGLSNVNTDLLEIYAQGLEIAVGKGRYPCFLLDDIKDYPEFYNSVRNGFMVMWRQLRFSLVIHSSTEGEAIDELCIDSIRGQDTFISDQDKLNIAQLLVDHNILTMVIGKVNRKMRVVLSDKARDIYERMNWLQSHIYENELTE